MKRAFSLSETLTVVTIIGVIAVTLLPVLSANIEKQKIETGIKKLYSSFSINVQTVLNEANCSSISCLRAYLNPINNVHQKEVEVKDADGNIVLGADNQPQMEQVDVVEYEKHVFANPKYMQIASDCYDCIELGSVMPDEVAYDYDRYLTYRLNNSAVMSLYNYENNCVTTGKVSVNEQSRDVCGLVIFDVNANKGPNVPGRDRFAYYIVDEPVNDSYIVPIGYNGYKGIVSSIQVGEEENANNSCSPDGSVLGYNCTARVMADNWKIKY